MTQHSFIGFSNFPPAPLRFDLRRGFFGIFYPNIDITLAMQILLWGVHNFCLTGEVNAVTDDCMH